MVTTSTTCLKRERVVVRVTSEEKELLQRAANAVGRTLSDFVLSSAATAAETTIRNREIIQLTAESTEAFVNAFLNPREPSEEMRKYARMYEEHVARK